jgi:hypothetical protein
VAAFRFQLTNRLTNPVLRRLLKTRAGRLPGRRLAVIRYTGVRTGRPHELIAGYARDDGVVWIWVGSAGQKAWWRNLRAPADIDLWLAGERYRARAHAVEGAQQPAAAAAGLTAYLATYPKVGRVVGARPGDAASITAAAPRVVLVRADVIDPRTAPAA